MGQEHQPAVSKHGRHRWYNGLRPLSKSSTRSKCYNPQIGSSVTDQTDNNGHTKQYPTKDVTHECPTWRPYKVCEYSERVAAGKLPTGSRNLVDHRLLNSRAGTKLCPNTNILKHNTNPENDNRKIWRNTENILLPVFRTAWSHKFQTQKSKYN
jgi:hypothetical protein